MSESKACLLLSEAHEVSVGRAFSGPHELSDRSERILALPFPVRSPAGAMAVGA
jgi:hypothetical protein